MSAEGRRKAALTQRRFETAGKVAVLALAALAGVLFLIQL